MNPDFRAALAAEESTPTPETKPETPEEPGDDAPLEEAPAGSDDEGAPQEEPPQGAPNAAVDAAAKALGKGKDEEEPPPEKKFWKGKFKEKDPKTGEEKEEEVEIEEEEVARIVGRRRSLDRAAFGWSEKLKDAERRLEERERQIAESPWAVMQEKGVDPFQAALSLVKEVVETSNLPPEQKMRLELQQERAAIDQEKARLEQAKKDEERSVQKKSYQERIVRELPQAMDKRGLVKHPLVMSILNDIGTAQMMASRAEFPDLEYAAEETEALLQEASAAWLGNLAEKNPAALVKALPASVLKAVQAHALASATKNPTRPAVLGTSPSAPRAAGKPRGETKPGFKTPQEWRQSLIADAHRR